jgi:hypothetical protein
MLACLRSAKRSSSAFGNSASSGGGEGNVARSAIHTDVCGNVSRHHAPHRRSVRIGTPVAARASRGTRARCATALASSTTASTYTRRPKNRSDGGSARARHPAAVVKVATVEHHVRLDPERWRDRALEALEEVVASPPPRDARAHRLVDPEVRVGEEEDPHHIHASAAASSSAAMSVAHTGRRRVNQRDDVLFRGVHLVGHAVALQAARLTDAVHLVYQRLHQQGRSVFIGGSVR